MMIPIDWMMIPIDWMMIPIDWMMIPIDWMMIPIDWMMIPICFPMMIPIDWRMADAAADQVDRHDESYPNLLVHDHPLVTATPMVMCGVGLGWIVPIIL
jgi:hypothetical protein